MKLEPKFQEIWGNFGHMATFLSQRRFFLPVRTPLARRLGLEDPNEKWLAFMDLA